MLQTIILSATLICLIFLFFYALIEVHKSEVNDAYNRGYDEAVRNVQDLLEGRD